VRASGVLREGCRVGIALNPLPGWHHEAVLAG
jgi:hypothetical protein